MAANEEEGSFYSRPHPSKEKYSSGLNLKLIEKLSQSFALSAMFKKYKVDQPNISRSQP